MQPRPIVLIVLDGWGCRNSPDANAIKSANTPVWNKLLQDCPQTTLVASGLEVGLPKDQMGNSEVGHLTMGAGRVVFQDLPRISLAIEKSEFKTNPVLEKALLEIAKNNTTLHVLGLLSKGGVHSHEAHIHALIRLAAEKGVKKIAIHAFLDGRDTPPQSAKASLIALNEVFKTLPKDCSARVASISGRYFAMDRDKRFERTEAVYNLLTLGKADYFASSALEALIFAYNRNETDEFVKPTIISPGAIIQDNDTVVFMNFRADRARQLSYAFCDPNFSGFNRSKCPKLSAFITLTEYASDLKASVVFPPVPLNNVLGEFLESQHLKQLRIAETEKYAHVTFFFNGGREQAFVGETRILIPSPKIATYDLCPEMSAEALTEALLKAIKEQSYDFIVCNYANADMVGHSGNFEATKKAIETLDKAMGEVIKATKAVGGEVVITADHGNAELMFDETTHQPHTAHTTEPVPFVYIGRNAKISHENGSLADIAPTIIQLLGLNPPPEMTGKSLLIIN